MSAKVSEINYIELHKLIQYYPTEIEMIKEQYLLLLSELTITNYLETSVFLKNIERIHEMGTIIVGYVGKPDDNTFELIASGTIIIEPKIIRGGNNVGHIEDVVVAKTMQGRGISQKILDFLKIIARENNCYKIILDCDIAIKNVYIKSGFDSKGVQMAKYLDYL